MDLFGLDISTTLIGIFLGIGLSAAAGFRVFLPLFVLSLASHYNLGDYVGLGTLAQNFQWVGSMPALIILGVATILEIGAYYIPFIDNALDSIAVPLAGIAGTILMASQLVDFSPVFMWTLAIIAGGGTAAAISGTTATGRATSSATTAGTGNFLVSTAETGAATALSSLAIFLPIIAFILVLILLFVVYKAFSFFRKRMKVAVE